MQKLPLPLLSRLCLVVCKQPMHLDLPKGNGVLPLRILMWGKGTKRVLTSAKMRTEI